MKLLATDVTKKVGDHFEKIRLVLSARQQQQSQSNSGNSNAGGGGSANGGSASGENSSVKFPISPHLVSRDRELEYLSKVAEVLVIVLCKHDYGNCVPVRHLLKEVSSSTLFIVFVRLMFYHLSFCII